MKKNGSTKIFAFIVIVILLVNLKSIHGWFATSLSGLNNFPEGAQTAIAFLSIIWVVVMIFKIVNK